MTDTATPAAAPVSGAFLQRFLWLSLATAVATVVIKGLAALLTGSVGLLSDALESTVNLVAAAVAIWALRLSDKPADHNHDFGHGKAEYMSSLVEGALIFVAAAAIIVSAIGRFIHPQPVESLGVGLLLSLGASVLNLAVGLVLVHQGKKHRSITLEADGHHLLTDVWTSVGVIAGVALVSLTGWLWLDPLVAMGVALNILREGWHLIRNSSNGLMDSAVDGETAQRIQQVLDRCARQDACQGVPLRFDHVVTRQAGQRCFVSMHMHLPAGLSLGQAAALRNAVEQQLVDAVQGLHATIEMMPVDVEPVQPLPGVDAVMPRTAVPE